MPALADFGYLHQAVLQGLVERQVVQGDGLGREQGKQDQILVDLFPADFDLIQYWFKVPSISSSFKNFFRKNSYKFYLGQAYQVGLSNTVKR